MLSQNPSHRIPASPGALSRADAILALLVFAPGLLILTLGRENGSVSLAHFR